MGNMPKKPRQKNFNIKLSEAVASELNKQLVSAREKRKPRMFRAALAKELDIHPSAMLRMEKGENGCTIQRFVEICLIHGLHPGDLMTEAYDKLKERMEG